MPLSRPLRRRAPESPPTRDVAVKAGVKRVCTSPVAYLVAVVVVAGLTAGCFPSDSGFSSSPYHNDPFLTCVRQHESGGRYTVDSPDGQYHGAYQFAQSTWDGTANHVGRYDLVGVDPHTVDATTQDDMAWALYQWLGSGPWAGSGC